jgi:hypothetical protein
LFGEHATLRGDARGRIPQTPVLLDKQTICEPKAATGIDRIKPPPECWRLSI